MMILLFASISMVCANVWVVIELLRLISSVALSVILPLLEVVVALRVISPTVSIKISLVVWISPVDVVVIKLPLVRSIKSLPTVISSLAVTIGVDIVAPVFSTLLT